jgi:hypothetical protein
MENSGNPPWVQIYCGFIMEMIPNADLEKRDVGICLSDIV